MKLVVGSIFLLAMLAACSSFDADETPSSGDAGAGDAAVDAVPDAPIDAGPVAPSDGLVGYWKFDEGGGPSAGDSSGQKNDGLITGGAWAPGHSGTAIRSAGSDRVRMPSLDGVKFPTRGTLSFYFNVESFTGNWIFDVYENRNAVVVSVQRNPSRVEVQITTHDSTSPDTPKTEFVASAPVAANEWHQAVVVWDGTAHHAYFYFDGALAGDKAISADWLPTEGTFQLFAPGCCSDAFRGLFDEMRLYNRALAPSEVSSLR